MKCPGQDSRYWKTDAIYEVNCPRCGRAVEFFKDDTTRKCNTCGHRFINPKMDFGCAAYCRFAEQCIGSLPPEQLERRKDLLKDRVAFEVKKRMKNDFRRIGRTARVAHFAERLGDREGANKAVVLCAAHLHDIETTPGVDGDDPTAVSTGAASAAPAEEILHQLGAEPDLAAAVRRLIAGLDGASKGKDIDFNVVCDARHLADLEADLKAGIRRHTRLENRIERLLTAAGRDAARQMVHAAGGSEGLIDNQVIG